MSFYRRHGKRLFDLVAGIAGLLVLAPVFLVVAALIKLNSAGPVFFLQSRIGYRLKPFNIIKFRTMTSGTPQDGRLMVAADARITRMGRYLRRIKIDELPQLLNVVRGDMSVVGPRPEIDHFVKLYTEDERTRIFSVRPGLTDLVTLNSLDEEALLAQQASPVEHYERILLPAKIAGHLEYAETLSLTNDLRIIAGTIVALSMRIANLA